MEGLGRILDATRNVACGRRMQELAGDDAQGKDKREIAPAYEYEREKEDEKPRVWRRGICLRGRFDVRAPSKEDDSKQNAD